MTAENPDILLPVEKTSETKTWLVNHVGDKLAPENEEVTIEMIIEVMATEFPELLLAVAEENFIRGYQQAITDVDTFESDSKAQTKIGK